MRSVKHGIRVLGLVALAVLGMMVFGGGGAWASFTINSKQLAKD